MSRSPRFRKATRLSAVLLTTGGTVLALAAPAFATPTSFTPGDLVVEQVGTAGGATPTSTSAPVSLWDYSTAGTPSGFQVDFPNNAPGADTATSHSLVESGTATYDGELTLSADGESLVVPGYDDASGVASLTSASPAPARTVGIVSPTGTIDTSTSLSDATTEGSNFRSATTALTGGLLYTAGGVGIATATDGGSAATYLNSDNVHQVEIVDGQLYESTTTSIDQVGTGVPVGGSPADTVLTTGPSKFEPAGFALVTLGSGSTPNTLYVADTGNGAVEKYSDVSGTWTETGSVAVPQVTGIAVSVSGGVASIYVTNATSSSAKYNSVLSGLTDSSGFDGTFTSSVTTLATAGTGYSFKGVTFAPVSPGSGAPEVPYAIALPGLAAALLGGGYLVYRRRTQAA